MTMRHLPLAALLTPATLLLGGCMWGYHDQPRSAATTPTLDIILRDATGGTAGTLSLREVGPGVEATVRVNGLTPGERGMHLHDVGRCEAPAFTSAGPHWNPTGRQHGLANPEGPHKGDLPSLVVAADGMGSAIFQVDANLATLTGGDGTALIIHVAADDNRTDPTGNSGARQICGAILPVR
jgi:superoxide dismutase, Cu-Zn family